MYQTTISKSREYQSLNKVFRAGLHLDAGAYASYGLNPTHNYIIIIHMSYVHLSLVAKESILVDLSRN